MDPLSEINELEAKNVELRKELKKEGFTEAKELAIRARITANTNALYAAAYPAPGNIHLRWHFILYLLSFPCFEFLFTCSRLNYTVRTC
jgi:hypothetical protein